MASSPILACVSHLFTSTLFSSISVSCQCQVLPIDLPTCPIIYLACCHLGNDNFNSLSLHVRCVTHLLPLILSVQPTLRQPSSVCDEVLAVTIHPNKCHHHCMSLIIPSNDTIPIVSCKYPLEFLLLQFPPLQ